MSFPSVAVIVRVLVVVVVLALALAVLIVAIVLDRLAFAHLPLARDVTLGDAMYRIAG